MGWLKDLFDKAFSLIPRVHKLEPFQAGIRTTWGTKVRDLGPGIWFYWPLVQTIWWTSTAPQVFDLKNQSCISLDGVDMAASGAIQVRIVSARKYILNVHDSEKSLKTLALGVLCEFFSTRTFDECRRLPGIKCELKKVLSRESKNWGVRIEKVFISDIGRVINIRHLGEGVSLSTQSADMYVE